MASRGKAPEGVSRQGDIFKQNKGHTPSWEGTTVNGGAPKKKPLNDSGGYRCGKGMMQDFGYLDVGWGTNENLSKKLLMRVRERRGV